MSKNYLDLTGLSNFLQKLKITFASLTHTHTKADIDDLIVDSSLSSTSINPVQNKVINAKFDVIDDEIAQKSQVQIIIWEEND